MRRNASSLFAGFTFVLGACAVAGCSSGVTVTPDESTSSAGGGSPGATSSSAGAGGASTTGSTSSTSAGSGGMEPGTSTLTAAMGPFAIGPGEESVKCVVADLGNNAAAFVRRFRTNLESGSHHMIIYVTDEAETSTPFGCDSFGVTGGSAIFIAQQAHSELVFPKDANGVPVGLLLGAHQRIRFEMHYINTTNAPLDVVGKVELDVLPATANVIPSGFLFEGAFSIPTIPALGEADTGVRFQSGLPGTHVFALTTHQHHLGTGMKVWYAKDENDTSTLVADSLSWSDPPLVSFDPPLDFPEGSTTGFNYQCHWKNPTPNPVHGGLGANDEMCFFWHYYYPVAH